MRHFIFISIVLGTLIGCDTEPATLTPAPASPVTPEESSDASTSVEDGLVSPGVDTVQAEPSDTALPTADTPLPDITQDAQEEEPLPECETSNTCEDLDPCTQNSCVEGVCVYTAIASCCTEDIQCDDGVSCTEDTCNAFTNECNHAFTESSCCLTADDCNDGKECTVDLCVGNQCIHPQEGLDECNCLADALCDDNNPCTSETCESGTCVYTPSEGPECCSQGECASTDESLSLCVYNLCWSGVPTCEQDSECLPPTNCWEGTCGLNGCSYTQKPNCCETAFDCYDGQESTIDLCIENNCVYSLDNATPCTTDAECTTDNPCLSSSCSRAGVCTVAASDAPGCCNTTEDCPVLDQECAVSACENFQCTETSLTGFQAITVTDFNSGTMEGWTEESNGAGAYWHLSSLNNPTGEFSLYFGQNGVPNYDVGIAQGSALSTTYPPQGGTVAIAFDRIAHVEPITSTDKFWLEAVVNGVAIKIWDKSYENGPGLGWKNVVLDISDVVGPNPFQLRFLFDSVDAQKNEYEGLYVDNVSLGILCE